MQLPNFRYEKECWDKEYAIVAGLDEVGRGAFAGPVVAGCVVFAESIMGTNRIKTRGTRATPDSRDTFVLINDSKQLTPKQREKADKWIRENCLACGIGSATVNQINKLGIKKATAIAFRKAIREANECLETTDHSLQAKQKAVDRSRLAIDYLLVDAFHIPRVSGLPYSRQKPIVKGDSLSISIASASIIAKVYRDGLMTNLAKNPKYKEYSWYKNKGYGTKEHRESIVKHGTSPLHRKQFVETSLKKI